MSDGLGLYFSDTRNITARTVTMVVSNDYSSAVFTLPIRFKGAGGGGGLVAVIVILILLIIVVSVVFVRRYVRRKELNDSINKKLLESSMSKGIESI